MRTTPQFPPDFVRYLESHGWRQEDTGSSWISFRRNDMRVFVKGDVIDVFIQTDDNPRRPLELLCAFHGWPILNEFTFMLQMHVMNVVSLKQFVRKAKREFADEAMTIDKILEHFGVEHLPEAY
ncbi:MAG TPA: hypothetical protein VFE32_17175 [Puia sp.]|jgi:hypothetical protein|nr:hypothetical protein [Puia sp.]